MTATTETTTTRTCPPGDMIHVAEIGPDADILIGDSGRFVLRVAGRSAEADAGELLAALTRAKPVAALVARSATPIGGMSAPVEAMLSKFGCTRVSGTEGISERDALVLAALDEAAENREYRASESCHACATADSGMCPEHRGHLDMAEQYRAERDRREAGR